MSDFILPDDIYNMAQQVTQDIADGWQMLARICVLRQYPMDIAEARVEAYVNVGGVSEIEALRKVYHEVNAS